VPVRVRLKLHQLKLMHYPGCKLLAQPLGSLPCGAGRVEGAAEILVSAAALSGWEHRRRQ
jgi:hypothetical protein